MTTMLVTNEGVELGMFRIGDSAAVSRLVKSYYGTDYVTVFYQSPEGWAWWRGGNGGSEGLV